MIGVDYIDIVLGVDVIEDFESVSSKDLIITINQHHYVLLTAVFGDCGVNVRHCCKPFLISYDYDVMGHIVLLDPFKD
jgi:hypothetical protein